jgi:hypothetical protein
VTRKRRFTEFRARHEKVRGLHSSHVNGDEIPDVCGSSSAGIDSDVSNWIE